MLVAITVATTVGAPAALQAQDRLIGSRAIAGGVTAEYLSFGGDGLRQGQALGQDSLRVRSVSQLSLPITASIPLGTAWTVDVTTVYARGRVTAAPGGSGTAPERTFTLDGVSDVRLRATGRVLGDAVLVTLGANLPTGVTELDPEQVSALRVLAAPALGLGAPPAGAGTTGTLGLLGTTRVGDWSFVGGASYELRTTVQPIAQLAAGANALDYRAGDVVRLTTGAEGLIGRHSLTVTASVDLFGTDRLGDANSAISRRVRLGPIVSTDAQLQLAAPRFKAVTLWSALRWRAPFARDGVRVEGSSGTYLDGGVRTVLPLRRTLDLVTALDARWHSGLELDQGLPTARVLGGGAILGLSQRLGRYALQPYLRLQAGTVGARTSRVDGDRQSFLGSAVGVSLLASF